MRKVLLSLIALYITLNSFAYDFQSGGFYYNITSSEEPYTVSLTYGDEMYSGDVVIPESVIYDSNTYEVNKIGNFAFYYDSISSVIISSNVKSLGIGAFSGCKILQEIVIPESVKEVGVEAFKRCVNLNNVTILGASSIRRAAFYGCDNLVKISLSTSLRTIGRDAFQYCCSLKEIVIPDSVTTIEAKVFYRADSLKSINLPKSITFIGDTCFKNSGLEDVRFDANIDTISESLFESCKYLDELILPNTIESIEKRAFANCRSLKSIKLSDSLEVIGDHAFLGDTLLKSILIPETVKTIEEYAFNGCSSMKSLVIASSVDSFGTYVFYDCTGLNSIQLYGESTAPCVGSYFFKNVDVSNCILYIPNGTMSYYLDSYGWKSFGNIIEVDSEEIYKAVTISAGGLSQAITKDEMHTITQLSINGNIDASDIFFIRDSMPVLKTLDLKYVKIDGYTGIVDTTLFRSAKIEMTFPENTLPPASFRNKYTLQSIVLPPLLSYIDRYSFSGCVNLDTITFSNTLMVNISDSISVFNYVDKENCVLVVPNGLMSQYRSSSLFNEFTQIEESPVLSTVSDKYLLQDKVKVIGSKLIVHSEEVDVPISLYNTQGILLGKENGGDIVEFILPSRGVYVVRVGEESLKVIY